MGCANSKEVATARSPKRLGHSRSWKKRLLIPIVEVFLHSRNHRAKHAPEPLPIAEKVRARQEEKEDGFEAMEAVEVIDVVALMEGLEEQDEKAACVTMPEARSDGQATPESWTDQDEISSLCEASSPESSRNHCGSPKSPRSPLVFGGPHSHSQRSLMKGLTRCGDNTPDIVVARNFSFNLRSCVDQASTPKVILDSTSPLLCNDGSRDFKHRLAIQCVTSSTRDNAANDDSDLLSTFESMMEQIRNDHWISEVSSSTIEEPPRDRLTLQLKPQECCTTTAIHGIAFDSKDVASEPELGDGYSRVPALFVDGRYIGGVERLNELKSKCQLRKLLHDPSGGDLWRDTAMACKGCGGASLVPCLDCNGSRRFIADNGLPEGCTECTVNGMVRCPLCS
ncbi:uncharacterized protein LOC112345470 [Selaginella moellendorffii]|uniref:uncharacterized protein LOC112345470 n=1 Tax=Selaginella moellendorffii TaxID=88036 RepID=UPI000D1CE6CD|nr:uncharacterized protein LOC112345470 [Selaginella moellendorffii]XP_024528088.1 uncharacterized protein LOC112345470 [Selaginella moellendorffii]|eukprot:XP_024528087.1 uncharacterized protein LOC112345470 [Selaginella moellendorffii]